MAAGNCASPRVSAGNGLHSLVMRRMTLSTEPCPMQLLSDSAALLERFARAKLRTKFDAAGICRNLPCMDDIPTRRNYTGRCWRKDCTTNTRSSTCPCAAGRASEFYARQIGVSHGRDG